MIKIKITDSITYSIRTLIREAGPIMRVCWPWLLIVVVVGYLDFYVLNWSAQLEAYLGALICPGPIAPGYNLCTLYNITLPSSIIYAVIPTIVYVALLRYFALKETLHFYKPEMRLERLYHTKVIRLGSYYFSFGKRELAYFILSVVVLVTISFCVNAGHLFFFQLGQTGGFGIEDNIANRISEMVNTYGYSILSNLFYALFALVYVDIAIRGFSSFRAIPNLIGRIKGNFIRLFLILFIVFLPYDIMLQSAQHLQTNSLNINIFGIFYYIPMQIVFYLCQFTSIIIIAQLYRKLCGPKNDVNAVQA